MRTLLLFIVLLVSGCIDMPDVDVLNDANKMYSEKIKDGVSYFCYDTEGGPYMIGDVAEVNGSEYACLSNPNGTFWAENKSLLNEL